MATGIIMVDFDKMSGQKIIDGLKDAVDDIRN